MTTGAGSRRPRQPAPARARRARSSFGSTIGCGHWGADCPIALDRCPFYLAAALAPAATVSLGAGSGRGVAQPGRALSSGGRGRRFESSLPDHPHLGVRHIGGTQVVLAIILTLLA